MRREETEIRRPFIQAISAAYSGSLPSFLMSSDGRILKAIYPRELEQYVAGIRELMEAAVNSARLRRPVIS